jgi:hypothetical protein
MKHKSGLCRVGFAKTMWIELIGFDVHRADYGVASLFRRAGFVPESMYLLLWNADFIHRYRAGQADFDSCFLRDDCCSYYGRPLSEEHPRQRWRNGDLKKLIACLHAFGVEVYLSVFDQQMSKQVAERYQMQLPEQWVDEHRELLSTLRDGRVVSSLCPWKRLSDGSFYEDFLLRQLLQLLPEFGFDGWHAADGFGHPRFPIYQGDFSDDMVEQSGCGKNHPARCDGDAAALSRRAASIWQDERLQWIEFHCQRRNAFFEKLLSGLRKIGSKVIINSCWTREPFEAKYRYGVDYAALAELGFTGWIVEAPVSVIETEGWRHDECDSLYKFIVALGRLRACLPGQRLLLLNTIKDTMEQYNSIRHVPMLLEAELTSFSSVCFHNNHKPYPALDGIVSCLSDGLSKSEWSWLLRRWNFSFGDRWQGCSQGVRVIYDQDALQRELTSYCRRPFCSSYRWHYLLLGAGAPLMETIELSQASTAPGPFLLIHPAFYAKEKLRPFLKKRGREVLCCGLRKQPAIPEKDSPQAEFPPDSWLNPLPEPEPGRALLEKLAGQLRDLSMSPWIASGQAHVWQQNSAEGKFLFVRNDRSLYQWVKVSLPGKLKCLKAVSEYLKPIDIWQDDSGNSIFAVKLPPLGVVVLKTPMPR